jgi:hypothetical protein
MRLRDRPLKLLAAVSFATVALLVAGAELLDGAIALRTWGDVSIGATPIRFTVFALAYVCAWLLAALGWASLRDEWNRDHRPRWKPPLEQPSHRGEL